jgi:hypothetical protein
MTTCLKTQRSLNLSQLSLTELRPALTYHLVFHYSLSLHINHLIFLHTYELGAFIFLTSLHPVLSLAAAVLSSIYISHIHRRSTCPAVPCFTWLIVVLLEGLALIVVDSCRSDPASLCANANSYRWLTLCSLNAYWPAESTPVLQGAMLGVALMLSSFIFQLIGHRLCEDLVSPPRMFHGLVAAPILVTQIRLLLLSYD